MAAGSTISQVFVTLLVFLAEFIATDADGSIKTCVGDWLDQSNQPPCSLFSAVDVTTVTIGYDDNDSQCPGSGTVGQCELDLLQSDTPEHMQFVAEVKERCNNRLVCDKLQVPTNISLDCGGPITASYLTIGYTCTHKDTSLLRTVKCNNQAIAVSCSLGTVISIQDINFADAGTAPHCGTTTSISYSCVELVPESYGANILNQCQNCNSCSGSLVAMQLYKSSCVQPDDLYTDFLIITYKCAPENGTSGTCLSETTSPMTTVSMTSATAASEDNTTLYVGSTAAPSRRIRIEYLEFYIAVPVAICVVAILIAVIVVCTRKKKRPKQRSAKRADDHQDRPDFNDTALIQMMGMSSPGDRGSKTPTDIAQKHGQGDSRATNGSVVNGGTQGENGDLDHNKITAITDMDLIHN